MLVYHGSNRRFRHLKISEKLCQHESTKTNEGLGIYFSTNRTIAESYGKYLYTIDINDNYIIDFRKKENCKKYVSSLIYNIYQKTNIAIDKYIDVASLIQYLYLGGISISGTGRAIYLLLDSNEKFYQLGSTKINQIYQILRNYDKNYLTSYMFNYHIKDIGVIKKIDDENIKITQIEFSYEKDDNKER